MTNPDELERAVERLTEMADWTARGDPGADGSVMLASSVAAEHSADLRLILSANREMREQVDALTEALTPSGDTKWAYHGEFKFQVTQWRENEDPDSDEEMEEYLADFTVPWTTVKEIMAAIKARSALLTTQVREGK